MSSPVTFGNGLTVALAPPVYPPLTLAPPPAAGPTAVLVPVAGPPGPAGGGASAFTYTQALAQSVWGAGSPPVITHNLGHYPVAWSLFDAAGRECSEYVVQHLDVNSCRVSMDLPTAGLIRLI